MVVVESRMGGRQWFSRALILSLAHTIARTSALSQQLCSSQNTGSSFAVVSDNFQSNGACSTTCAGHAFAIVQYQNCWCSDYLPADTTSTGSCSVACPGYPYENCGDKSSGLFGYVALGKAPLGTQGASPSNSPTQQATSIKQATQPSTQAASSPNPVTIVNTVTAQQSTQVSFVSITPSTTPTSSSINTPTLIPVSITPNTPTTSTTPTPTTPSTSTTPISTTSSSATSSTSITWTPTPYMSVMTVTGEVKTLTVTPTAPPVAQTTVASVAKGSNGGFWQSPAKVGVTFFFVAAIIVAAIAALIWFLLRRRRQSDVITVPSTTGNNTPQRRPSRLSQMGLIGGSVQRQATVPSIQTSGWGPGTGSGAEKSPADTLNADRRSSYPRTVDQRLEPTALWNPLHDNGSHISVRSFRDDQDYSRRMLRVANPDDEGTT